MRVQKQARKFQTAMVRSPASEAAPQKNSDDVLLIDSQTPVCFLATLAGLTIYLAAPQHGVFARSHALTRYPRGPVLLRHAAVPTAPSSSRRRQKNKCPMGLTTGHSVLATSYSRTAYRRTTIGAAAFHFRVRNGNGWDRYAIVTRPSDLKASSRVWWRNSRIVKP